MVVTPLTVAVVAAAVEPKNPILENTVEKAELMVAEAEPVLEVQKLEEKAERTAGMAVIAGKRAKQVQIHYLWI